MSSVYYNEFEAYPAKWLRNLISEGHLPDGDVDESDIANVQADTLHKYDQCHFFAGIGGWPLALQMADIPASWNVWTGSCPCQPFSQAGQQKGSEDERHLWPIWKLLIEECSPAIVFGEQVASKLARNEWLPRVSADLESLGYTIAAADLPAASVGAPHIRQRLWWGAYTENCNARQHESWTNNKKPRTSERQERANLGNESQRCISNSRVAYSTKAKHTKSRAKNRLRKGPQLQHRGGCCDIWKGKQYIPCEDGKARPIKPRITPLANGVPNRVGRLRAYGNAIVPQVAAVFIRSAVEAISIIEDAFSWGTNECF